MSANRFAYFSQTASGFRFSKFWTSHAPSKRPSPKSARMWASQAPPTRPPAIRSGLMPASPAQYDRGDPLRTAGPTRSAQSAARIVIAQQRLPAGRPEADTDSGETTMTDLSRRGFIGAG